MMYLVNLAAFALWASLAAAAPTGCNTAKYVTVDTSNGPITGHLADNSQCVVEYLGIPYAKPPVGDLRFAPPQSFNSREPYEAKNFGFDCPLSPSKAVDYPGKTAQAQNIISYFASAAGTPQSEDCLTLNIWSKATPNSAKANKPVLVFFYGGRFAIGNTNSPFYNGKYFADAEDIVVVTVNYRINIFGFPGAPGETANLGLRDQRAAVQWVRDNIWRFGGNPSKITISGQSSGGVAVDYWAYAYQKDPIVNGIIAPSGDAFSFPVNTASVQEKNWNSVVAAVSCTGASDVMACMRKVDWEVIKTAAAAIRPASSSSVLRSIPPFYPKPDNETVFSDYVSLTKAGKFAKLPILFGHNHNEDGYYRIPAYGNGGVVPTDAQVTSFLLESFTCPVSYQAQARRNNGVAAWAYRYMADWDNTRLFPTSGAYHGVDLHMIFGASGDVSGIAPTTEQKKLTKIMQNAWYSFSDSPSTGLSKLGWPQFNAKEKSLILLGNNTKARVDFVKPSVYDAPCSTVTMGALGTSV
ncbi:Alpha/Beta hydrolase protein [Ilyonectria destructans]|nr:Alpha/Beta hydrolase protein [Ilyonectria destructans]